MCKTMMYHLKKNRILFSLFFLGGLFVFWGIKEYDEVKSYEKKILYVGTEEIDIEVARTPQEKQRGLSQRENLLKNSGMLFIFESDTQPFIWMKDMKFSIDILWIDAKKVIVGWEEYVAPETYPKTFQPEENIRYVLEVPAGFVKEKNIRKYEKVFFEE